MTLLRTRSRDGRVGVARGE